MQSKGKVKQSLAVFTVAFCILFSGCATFKPDPWTKEQVMLQGASTVLDIIDWGLTLDIESKDEFYEKWNPALGEDPSRKDINIYFPCFIAGKYFVAWVLPSDYRKYWYGGTMTISICCVGNNYRIGLRVNF